LAILVFGVHGLATWVSFALKAASIRESPHELSTGWKNVPGGRFMVYYGAKFSVRPAI
jgi:hypothetical protein